MIPMYTRPFYDDRVIILENCSPGMALQSNFPVQALHKLEDEQAIYILMKIAGIMNAVWVSGILRFGLSTPQFRL